jgi:hypothetical protein
VVLEPALRPDLVGSAGAVAETLAGYRPDIVAFREPNELVFVEIRPRGWVGAEPTTEELRRRIQSAIPWARLITVVPAEAQQESAPSLDAPLESEGLHRLLAGARDAAAIDHPELAVVLSCAAAEGALRHIVPPEVTRVSDMLRWAAVEGPLERPVYRILRHAFRFRDPYVHGRRLQPDVPEGLQDWAPRTIGAAERAVIVLVDEDWPRPEPDTA